ncbi:hypothetical protein MHYP_G00297180 [Metynnis hypsauchen]
MPSLVAIRLLVLVLGLCSLRAAGQGRSTPATCSPLCRCDEDGGADCSGKGLSTVPTGLSAFTYYLKHLNFNAFSWPASCKCSQCSCSVHRVKFCDMTIVFFGQN